MVCCTPGRGGRASGAQQQRDEGVQRLLRAFLAGRHDPLGLVEELPQRPARQRHARAAARPGQPEAYPPAAAVRADAHVPVAGRLLQPVAQEVAQHQPPSPRQRRVVGSRGEPEGHRQRVRPPPRQAEDGRPPAAVPRAVVDDDLDYDVIGLHGNRAPRPLDLARATRIAARALTRHRRAARPTRLPRPRVPATAHGRPDRTLDAWLTRRPTVPRRGRSPTGRVSTASGTSTAASSTSARPRACAAGWPATSPTSTTCTRAPSRWCARRPPSNGRWSPPRSRRSSSNTPGSRSTTRGSTSATATTRATRAWRSPSTRNTRGCR